MKFHKNAGDVSNAQNKTISGLCEDCNKRQYRYLVNVARKYTRDFTNWKYLCLSCRFDLTRS
jgi:hypothetical protein